jgi:hypothetical protein
MAVAEQLDPATAPGAPAAGADDGAERLPFL